jgi:hypothetical protein
MAADQDAGGVVKRRIIAAIVLSVVAACAGTPPASIGVGTMDAQGVITLQLMARGDGAVGDAVLVYRPGDPHYAEIKAHLDPIKPGDSKPVPPWPK